LPELDDDLPPQPLSVPITAISSIAPSIARHPRLREGIPKKTSRARTAPPPACIQPFCLPSFTGEAIAVVVATEVIVTVDVAEAEPLPNVIDGVLTAQEGRSVAPVGEEVRAQARAMVPE
jgi:hypothetical protein